MDTRRKGAVLGVAGTAKNTGKTTTLNGIMREILIRQRRVLVTSIGFDGEDVDNVTGLPKPRIYCERGVMIATAARCLSAGSARVRVDLEPEIDTALGKMVIGTVQSDGLVVLAGPNKTGDLERLLFTTSRLKVASDLTLVDGAFSRIAPMGVCDALVLATGAARNTSILTLAKETAGIVRVFAIPEWAGADWFHRGAEDRIALRYRDGRVEERLIGSMLGPQDIPEDAGMLEAVYIPGAVSAGALELLASSRRGRAGGRPRGRAREWDVVIKGAASLLAAGDAGAAARAVESVGLSGGNIYALRGTRLLAVTVNPFYPEKLAGGTYEGRFVDAGRLLREMRRSVAIPVYDVAREGTAGLGDLVDGLVAGAIIGAGA